MRVELDSIFDWFHAKCINRFHDGPVSQQNAGGVDCASANTCVQERPLLRVDCVDGTARIKQNLVDSVDKVCHVRWRKKDVFLVGSLIDEFVKLAHEGHHFAEQKLFQLSFRLGLLGGLFEEARKGAVVVVCAPLVQNCYAIGFEFEQVLECRVHGNGKRFAIGTKLTQTRLETICLLSRT